MSQGRTRRHDAIGRENRLIRLVEHQWLKTKKFLVIPIPLNRHVAMHRTIFSSIVPVTEGEELVPSSGYVGWTSQTDVIFSRLFFCFRMKWSNILWRCCNRTFVCNCKHVSLSFLFFVFPKKKGKTNAQAHTHTRKIFVYTHKWQNTCDVDNRKQIKREREEKSEALLGTRSYRTQEKQTILLVHPWERKN